jgi:glutaredoxin
MKTKYILFITLCLLGITQYSHSQIYKWVDKNGDTQFSDQKPINSQKTEHVKVKINSISNEYASTQKVIIYSASWCGVCKHAKKYFKNQGISYKEYDIEKSAKGRKDFKHLNGRGVPIILVGKQRMDGFDASAFEKMYKG